MTVAGAVAVCRCAFVLVQVAPLCPEHIENIFGDADLHLSERLWPEIETDGDKLTDLHVWRLGPGPPAAVMSVRTTRTFKPRMDRRLRHFAMLSHVAVEVHSL